MPISREELVDIARLSRKKRNGGTVPPIIDDILHTLADMIMIHEESRKWPDGNAAAIIKESLNTACEGVSQRPERRKIGPTSKALRFVSFGFFGGRD